MSLNKWIGIGRITKDLEKETTPSGISKLKFTIAVEDDYKPKDGDRKTSFIDCVAWRYTADFLEKYSGKGRNICVVGKLDQNKWEDKDGNKRSKLEVQVDNVYFADSKRDGESSGSSYSSSESAAPDVDASQFTELPDDESELPF